MATKKTNFISYELEKLDSYIKSLNAYLDSIDLEHLVDRLDVRQSAHGNPIVKVVASKETQVTSYRITLEKLPALYEALNRLRKIVDIDDTEEEIGAVRGGKELPGLFKNRMLTQGNVKASDKKDNDETEFEEL